MKVGVFRQHWVNTGSRVFDQKLTQEARATKIGGQGAPTHGRRQGSGKAAAEADTQTMSLVEHEIAAAHSASSTLDQRPKPVTAYVQVHITRVNKGFLRQKWCMENADRP